ncbi:MAG: helix-turn-helix domain-containing protein [Anaerolineae bacterium]|nr:helix-turn-helix domain-containing protein [Anaerolineae bacterium]
MTDSSAGTKDAVIWVGLAEAARILGVHPATVRSWADRGLLPSQRTPGGHRRFRRSDLEGWIEGQNAAPANEAQLLVQSAVGRARIEVGEGQVGDADWYRTLDQEALHLMRPLGRRLMEVLGRYLGSPSDQALSEARLIGLDYGKLIRGQNLTLGQAIEGFFTFNDFVIDTFRQISDVHRVSGDRTDAVRKIYAFTREIILALVDAYETEQ